MNVPVPPLPPGGYDGTEGAYIRDLLNEISATTYVEAIVARQRSGVYGASWHGTVPAGPCGRGCTQYTTFDICRELYDQATVDSVHNLVYKLGLPATGYAYYRRDSVTQALIPLTLTSKVSNRWSVLIVPVDLSQAALIHLLAHLAFHRAILPARVPY